ncbi:DUF5940 domain-containing protein [Candidatus Acetothermia bacterium]|jgi:betaine reductase|nr:DUF5940 domain-containing protein [Candidatus Acetothermia bacterium]MCI2427881.1 DUF5940 domain-containing protein [Candidatus Acetothermia bacterium]MCI2428904.1 DUF5940 domain-containing protein [Candidatus Acetothermia bacterium]
MLISSKAIIKQVAYILAHVPDLVRYGSKPAREIAAGRTKLAELEQHLRSFDDTVAYPPNQIFIGNISPDDYADLPEPWYENLLRGKSRYGPFGEIMPQDELYGIMKMWDKFNLIDLSPSFTALLNGRLATHPLITTEDRERLGEGTPQEKIEVKVEKEASLPLYHNGQLVGCVNRAHEQDETLTAHVMLENLLTKVTGILVTRHLIRNSSIEPDKIDYLLSCSEEAVGDRYNRGGGNMAKAIGEEAYCVNASGCDIKSFCAGTVLAIIHSAALISAGLFNEIIVVGGGSFSKIGMKFQGHMKHNMPILEDVLGGIAILLSRDDGTSPVVNLACTGKHDISAGATAQAIYEVLILDPLQKMGMKITDVDKYAVEMHNPEVTLPMGSGNVPLTNYKTIAAMAAMRGEIDREELPEFIQSRGMPGFSPTQGHIASAVPYLGHALKLINDGKINNALFAAKGSLFLGRMTNLADGVSFLLEKNSGRD